MASQLEDIPENIARENLEGSSDGSGMKKDMFEQNLYNKHYSSFNNSYSSRMSLILKIGTGGDQQEHVSTPRSIRERDSETPIGGKRKNSRATSAS